MHRINHQQHVPTAVIFGILAAICFTLMSLFSKLLGDHASTEMILFARFATSLILILPWAIRFPRETFTLVQPFRLFLRSTLTLMTLFCFFYALKYIPLTNALLLTNTSPLFIPLILLVFHQIKTPRKVWIGIALGFIGIVLILQPSPLAPLQPSLLGLASGITAAGSVITIRFMTKSIPLLSILFYNFLIGTIVSAILLPFAWIPFDNETLFFLFCVGIFGSSYYFLSAISFAKAPVRITSSLSFLQIIFGFVADWLIWNTTPDWISILGIVAVILGGILTIYYGQKELVTKKPN